MRIFGQEITVVETEGKSSYHCRPYRKIGHFPRGWLEKLLRMGLWPPVFFLTKNVRLSDVRKDQNRLQISRNAIAISSSSRMKALARRAEESADGVTVKVMDRMGNIYTDMKLRRMPSTGHFRINGPDYCKFVKNAGVEENQMIDVWGLGCQERSDVDVWLALINYVQ